MYQMKTFKLTLMSVANDPVSLNTKTGANIIISLLLSKSIVHLLCMVLSLRTKWESVVLGNKDYIAHRAI